MLFKKKSPASRRALGFVALMGVISLFSDMAYQGARSITGAYLAELGANATMVSLIAGFGEFIGYALRWVSGYMADKTNRYWLITFVGYTINLLAIPALALTNHWQIAAALIVAERFGKAIRTPARDAMLSQASQTIGMGWGFGLHQALDQIGGLLGPLVIALVLYLKGSYQEGFEALSIPAAIALLILAIAYHLFKDPAKLNIKRFEIQANHAPVTFWIYIIAISLIGLGFANFPLISFHFAKAGIMSPTLIPISYGAAMGMNALLAPLLGHLYDRIGISLLIIVTFVTAIFAPLVFFGNGVTAFIGVMLWGISVSAQDSLMRAIVGNMISSNKRASAYGLFNMIYGLAWFLGSAVLGFLYEYSLTFMVIFSVAAQLCAIPWLISVKLKLKPNHGI